MYFIFFFFFKQKTAYEIVSRDWSSDVCSSDLERPDREKRLDAGLGRGGADLAVVAGRVGAELGHLPQDRDAPSRAGPLREQPQGDAHRDRVCVPRVVDQQPPV